MTFPSSGTLTYNDFNTKAGRASGTAIDMAWIYNNTKSGQRSYAINNYYNKNWYQRNVDGNCNNGNCNCACDCVSNCNCGSINCLNCFSSQCINCANCDTRAWFQNNCNCACTYNCNLGQYSYNCACDCSTCFPAYSMVMMSDGSYKRIDQIKIGDRVDGGYGYVNTVLAYHEAALGMQPIYVINGRHRTTGEHRHYTTEGWAAINTEAAKTEKAHEIVVDNDGTREKRKNIKFNNTNVIPLKVGMSLITNSVPELIESIVPLYNEDPDQLVYTLMCDGSHSHIVNGVIVSAWARDDDFDYSSWTPKTTS